MGGWRNLSAVNRDVVPQRKTLVIHSFQQHGMTIGY
jgi:hypothetical protein